MFEEVENKKETYENGDAYDEDTGDYIGNICVGAFKPLPPAQISIFIEGFWYVYKPSCRMIVNENEETPKS